MITIQTKASGELEIDPKEIIEFPDGIFAFEQFRQYVLLPGKKNSSFRWLQSTEEPNLAFLVLPIPEIKSDYSPRFAREDLNSIGATPDSSLEFFGIVTIPPNEPEKMTINLQGPLVIFREIGKGAQIIAGNEDYSVRALVLELIEQGGT